MPQVWILLSNIGRGIPPTKPYTGPLFCISPVTNPTQPKFCLRLDPFIRINYLTFDLSVKLLICCSVDQSFDGIIFQCIHDLFHIKLVFNILQVFFLSVFSPAWLSYTVSESGNTSLQEKGWKNLKRNFGEIHTRSGVVVARWSGDQKTTLAATIFALIISSLPLPPFVSPVFLLCCLFLWDGI